MNVYGFGRVACGSLLVKVTVPAYAVHGTPWIESLGTTRYVTSVPAGGDSGHSRQKRVTVSHDVASAAPTPVPPRAVAAALDAGGATGTAATRVATATAIAVRRMGRVPVIRRRPRLARTATW